MWTRPVESSLVPGGWLDQLITDRVGSIGVYGFSPDFLMMIHWDQTRCFIHTRYTFSHALPIFRVTSVLIFISFYFHLHLGSWKTTQQSTLIGLNPPLNLFNSPPFFLVFSHCSEILPGQNCPFFGAQNPPRFFRACPQWELSRRSSVALAEPGDKNHAVDDGKWPFFTGKSGEIDHGIMLNNEKIINDSQIRAIFFRW
jgi:hypothetical protein